MSTRISKDPNVNWRNNAIQYPRLLAEVFAIELFPEQYKQLADAMDLSFDQLDELFARAQAEWEVIKSETKDTP